MPHRIVLLWAAILCGGDPPGPTVVESGVIVAASFGSFSYGWMQVDTGEVEPRHVEVLSETVVAWHFDPRVGLPARDLRVGTRIRFWATTPIVRRIEVVSLGPLAMEAAVEEFVVAASGRNLGRGLTPGELAAADALGSRSHLVREAVSRALAEKGARALRFLIWARHHDDLEVRVRAEALLGRLGWQPAG